MIKTRKHTCEYEKCKKAFDAPPSRKGRFCSRACYYANLKANHPARVARVKRVCEHPKCNETFLTTIVINQLYCSQTCYHNDIKVRPRRPTTIIDRLCKDPDCGKTFKTPRCRAKVYCSYDCVVNHAIHRVCTGRQCPACPKTIKDFRNPKNPRKFCSSACIKKWESMSEEEKNLRTLMIKQG